MTSKPTIIALTLLLFTGTGCHGPRFNCIVDSTNKTLLKCRSFNTKEKSSDPNHITNEKVTTRLYSARQKILLTVDGECEYMAVSPSGAIALMMQNNIYDFNLVLTEPLRVTNGNNINSEIKIVDDIPLPPGNKWMKVFRIDGLDILDNIVAVYCLESVNGWENTIKIIDLNNKKTITKKHSISFGYFFPYDVTISPDHQYIALYAHYLVRQFPEWIDWFYPYSQKAVGYLAIWRVSDGKLIKELSQKDFYRPAGWMKITQENRRPFRVYKHGGELVWLQTGEILEIAIPGGHAVKIDLNNIEK